MAVPANLSACAGTWRGQNRLHDPHTNQPADSPSQLTVTPMGNGQFVRVDYTWAYRGQPQEGSILIAGDAGANSLVGHWFDTWHQRFPIMALSGAGRPDGTTSLRGSYAAPPGPDWGWRIELAPQSDQVQMRMFNIWPEGREDPAVEASYQRGP